MACVAPATASRVAATVTIIESVASVTSTVITVMDPVTDSVTTVTTPARDATTVTGSVSAASRALSHRVRRSQPCASAQVTVRSLQVAAVRPRHPESCADPSSQTPVSARGLRSRVCAWTTTARTPTNPSPSPDVVPADPAHAGAGSRALGLGRTTVYALMRDGELRSRPPRSIATHPLRQPRRIRPADHHAGDRRSALR